MSPAARRTDPETSHDAAKSVKETSATMRGILYVLGKYGPMTDEDMIDAYYRDWDTPASVSGLRSRRSELTAAPHYLVVDTGARQKLASGRQSIVWGLREEIDGQS